MFFPHDVTVATAIAGIVTGGADSNGESVSETDLFAREREAFIQLAKTPQTLARITQMLSGGGTLRN